MAVFQSLAPIQGDTQAASTSAAMVTVDPGLPVTDWWGADQQLLTHVWRSQPAVRKVLDFKARQVASIPLHAYTRVDGGRERDRDSKVARMLGNPSGQAGGTAFRFWHAILLDRLIYDRWCAAKLDTMAGGLQLRRVPPRRWKLRSNALDEPVAMRIADEHGEWKDFPLDRFLFDVGYAQDGANGASPVLTLADLIDEMKEAVSYRRSMWKRGARVSGVVEREKPWSSKEARDRFSRGWQQFMSGGAKEGGTALLEDGMKYNPMEAWSPQDVNDLEGRRLTDIEVASFFHVPPEMVGARQGNYANMAAFRNMLYRDTLGPDIVAWEQAVNQGLSDQLGEDSYLEAYVEAKLRGSFEEQATILSSSTGAPWMTRSEARDRMNLPPIDGDDELVVPLNVLVGGQSSPRDAGSQNRTSGTAAAPTTRVKARAPQTHDAKHEQVLRRFFDRQARTILSRIGAGQEWWDQERWDDELTDDLTSLHLLSATAAARAALEAAGLDPDVYDEDRTIAYLAEAARRAATSINAATRDQVSTALADPGVDEDGEPVPVTDAVAGVFDTAKEQRAGAAATTAVTFASGFGVLESGRQTGAASKTWVVTSSNPRPSHAAIDGETVGLDEDFSNGLPWPGAAGSDADEVAGCRCAVDINYP